MTEGENWHMNITLNRQLEEIARRKCFNVNMTNRNGGSAEDINCFVECLSNCLKSGMTINGLQYDFIVNPFTTFALLRVELHSPKELQRIEI